jgi:hypothetical protein
MSQSLEIMKLGRQSNSGMLFKRTFLKPSEGRGLTRYDEDFIRKHSDGHALVSASSTSAFISNRKPAVKIFVAYDSDLSRDRARQIEEELGRRLGRSFTFSISAWKLKSLWHPKMLRMAIEAAVNAEIIVFSLLSGGDMPQAVKNWLEKGLVNTPANRVCLLALLETGGALMPRLSPAEVYLSNLSSRIGVDCLCYSDCIPMARFGRHNQQLGGNNRGSGCARHRLKTPSVRFGAKKHASNAKGIEINV